MVKKEKKNDVSATELAYYLEKALDYSVRELAYEDKGNECYWIDFIKKTVYIQDALDQDSIRSVKVKQEYSEDYDETLEFTIAEDEDYKIIELRDYVGIYFSYEDDKLLKVIYD